MVIISISFSLFLVGTLTVEVFWLLKIKGKDSFHKSLCQMTNKLVYRKIMLRQGFSLWYPLTNPAH